MKLNVFVLSPFFSFPVVWGARPPLGVVGEFGFVARQRGNDLPNGLGQIAVVPKLRDPLGAMIRLSVAAFNPRIIGRF